MAIMQTKKHLSKPQIAGWIIWWLVTILIGLALGTLLWQGADSAAVQIGATVFGGLYIIQQIIMIFCLKLLHKNNNYVWPVVTIVIGVLGSILYLIPGIWALLINNSARNNQQTPITH